MRTKLLVTGVASALFCMVGMVHANLLVNGDFESSVAITDTNGVPTGFYQSADWTQWSWSAGWSEITVKPEPNGGNSTILANVGNGWYNGGGGVYQVVPGVVPGTNYMLTVDSGADAWWQPTGEMALIFLDSTGTNELAKIARNTVDQANGIPNDTLQPMQNYSLIGTAPAGAAMVKVELASRMPDGVGGAITFDNAVLDTTAIPEPATLAFLGFAGSAIYFLRRLHII